MACMKQATFEEKMFTWLTDFGGWKSKHYSTDSSKVPVADSRVSLNGKPLIDSGVNLRLL
jgi:hypothetical protein